jgi:hypothetical protein
MPMKNLLKIVLWICLVVVITAAASWITVVIFRDDIFAFVETTINSRITTKTRVGKYSFSVLKRFPRASVKLSDVTLLSSTGFDKREFTDYNADTLLYAGSVTLEFRLTDLMKGIYRIENASVSDGTLNLLTDRQEG